MLLLAKIQSEKYIMDMYENQYLYFSSLKEFRNHLPDKTGRLDPKEMNLKNHQLSYLSIKAGEKEFEFSKLLKGFNGQYSEYLKEPAINCCSLYSIILKDAKSDNVLDERVLNMGNKALLIYDHIRFFTILDKSISDCNLHYSRKFVEYYDPKKYNGDLTLHHKDQVYGFQNEYRILIAPTDNEPIKISLPGLKEISVVVDTKMLNSIYVHPLIEENKPGI